MKQHVQQNTNSVQAQEIDDVPSVIADIEIINALTIELKHPSHKVITTKQVEQTNRKLLLDNGLKENKMKKSYKYLKQLII